MFPSIDKVPKITSPVLVIHGTDDEVIDFSHGLQIYDRCPRTVEPLWVVGAGHNDVELYGQYLERLKQFIDVELSINWHEATEEGPQDQDVPENVSTATTEAALPVATEDLEDIAVVDDGSLSPDHQAPVSLQLSVPDEERVVWLLVVSPCAHFRHLHTNSHLQQQNATTAVFNIFLVCFFFLFYYLLICEEVYFRKMFA